MHTANWRQRRAKSRQTVPPEAEKSVPPWENRSGGTVREMESVIFWHFTVSPEGHHTNKKPSKFTEFEGFVLILAPFVSGTWRYGR
jgi:hypothetical protein